MRIGMILPSQFPPDIRLDKEIGTLQKAHEVQLLCPNSGGQATREILDGVEVHRVFSRLQRGWSSWNLMRSCRSRDWRRAIEGFVTGCRPDVLHVHDLPLVGTALEVAKRHSVPLIADLHENYPAMLDEGNSIPINKVRSLGKLVSRVTVSIPGWEKYEREVVPKVDQVIVVVEEAKDRLVSIGVSPEQVHVVSNYASKSEMRQRAKMEERSHTDQAPFRVLYAGGFDPTRDLRTVIDAVGKLPQTNYPNLHVHLVGGKDRDLGQLQKKIDSLRLTARVSLSAWMPLEGVEQLIAEADVGLVPHVKSPHTDSTIPHKLFQYMWQRLPVIVSNCAPLERIVTEVGCGMVYASGNADEMAHCISEMYNARDRSFSMGIAGHKAVEERYNWDVAGQTLLSVYEQLDLAQNLGTANAAK